MSKREHALWLGGIAALIVLVVLANVYGWPW